MALLRLMLAYKLGLEMPAVGAELDSGFEILVVLVFPDSLAKLVVDP